MESFLGTIVYVSRFCKDFAQFAGPLHDSIKCKRSRDAIELSDDLLRFINELKNRLTSPPVLSLPDFSKSFAELNYPVRDQELLAIMHALRLWRVYLLDRLFTVETDHKSIEMIMTQKTINSRVVRWFNELAEFHPLFKWIPGATNTESRDCGEDQNEQSDSVSNREDNSWNKDLQWIIKKLKQGEDVPKYSLQYGILYYQYGEDETPRLYFPDGEDMKNRVICENHDAVSTGHPGFYKTYLAVREKYYWPKMMKYIQRYVNTCEMCQRNKARQTKPSGLLQPLDTPKGRWTDIHGLCGLCEGSWLSQNHCITKFTSKLWQRTVKALETQHNLSSAFRPRTDGQTERTNRFIGDYLRCVINPAQNDWDDYLHLAEFVYNRRKKLAPRYIGPFPVVKKISKDSYELGISKGLKLHPYITAETVSQGPKAKAASEQVFADGTEGQLVEAVIGHQKYTVKPQYKIRWLVESKAEATWEPVENLNQIPGLIDLY
ncbi:unnamed protein product [Phytophthora fragariaefolia]|uniref:Unnamed protein product n=1 Tax=Phytophthora fragariaefolia TaxID=1490495 RepID=A0A9W7CUU9_9STRA|nr:unnamed protein product [Phytophthora fragariaefolia]